MAKVIQLFFHNHFNESFNFVEKIKGKIHFLYDSDCDVLFSYIEKPFLVKSIDMDNGILVHIDSNSKKIVGFSVVNYQRRIKEGIMPKIPFFEKLKLPSILL